jgi:hypothetical protein
VSIHGAKIPHSNVIDLINEVVRNRKYTKNPAGIEQFVHLLKQVNVPTQYYSVPFKYSYKRPEAQESPGKTKGQRKHGRKPYSGRRKFFENWEEDIEI